MATTLRIWPVPPRRRRAKFCFAAPSRSCWASAPSRCSGCFWNAQAAPVSKDALIEAALAGTGGRGQQSDGSDRSLAPGLRDDAGGADWIETLPRRGYRYVGPAVATDDCPQCGYRAEPRRLALPDKPSVAVLPFSNLSGDPEQEYFADGMVDDIITGLSRIKWLFVIARNSTFTYKGRAVDVKQVGRELGVRYVLEGSVRKDGDRVRITGQLIDAATGAHVWAERYDRSSTTFSRFRTKSR